MDEDYDYEEPEPTCSCGSSGHEDDWHDVYDGEEQ